MGERCRRCGRVHEKCKAHNQSGGPCGRSPATDQEVCRYHGGNAPQARQAAATRQVERRARKALAQVWANREDVPVVDALEELARVAGEVVAFKDMLRHEVEQLNGAITQEWSDKTVELMTPEGMRQFAVIKEDMRAVVLAYERAQERAAKVLANIVKLDLAGRLLALRTEQAAALEQAIRAGLADVDMAVEVRRAAEAAISDRLVAAAGGRVVRGEIAG